MAFNMRVTLRPVSPASRNFRFITTTTATATTTRRQWQRY